VILFSFFQVYILVRLSCLRVSKQSVYKDVCVVPLLPYKTTGKSIFLCILICVYFCVTNWKTRDSAPNDSKHSLT